MPGLIADRGQGCRRTDSRDEGKTEAEVVAAKPLADLDAKWGNPTNPQAAVNFVKNVYNSFTRA